MVISSFQFSSVAHLCLTLRPHGLNHTRLPCPTLTPEACSNSCPLSQWCHPTTSSSIIPLSFCFQFFSTSGFFSNELALCIRWPKYWNFSFSISLSNEHSGYISIRMDWFDLIAVQGTLQHCSSKASVLRCLNCSGEEMWPPYVNFFFFFIYEQPTSILWNSPRF